MEELRDLLDMDTSSKDIYVREDDKGNTGTMRCLSVKLPAILSYKFLLSLVSVFTPRVRN